MNFLITKQTQLLYYIIGANKLLFLFLLMILVAFVR